MNFSDPISQINHLNSIRAYGTSLVSFYITSSSDISIVNSRLTKEMSDSSNIKDKSVRKDVQSALRSMQHYFKSLKQIPDNGVAIFSGANQSLV